MFLDWSNFCLGNRKSYFAIMFFNFSNPLVVPQLCLCHMPHATWQCRLLHLLQMQTMNPVQNLHFPLARISYSTFINWYHCKICTFRQGKYLISCPSTKPKGFLPAILLWIQLSVLSFCIYPKDTMKCGACVVLSAGDGRAAAYRGTVWTDWLTDGRPEEDCRLHTLPIARQ